MANCPIAINPLLRGRIRRIADVAGAVIQILLHRCKYTNRAAVVVQAAHLHRMLALSLELIGLSPKGNRKAGDGLVSLLQQRLVGASDQRLRLIVVCTQREMCAVVLDMHLFNGICFCMQIYPPSIVPLRRQAITSPPSMQHQGSPETAGEGGWGGS